MSYSEVEIVNIALSMLGRDPIRDFSDTPTDPKSGKLSRRIYKITRDALVSSHDWSFARKTVTLQQRSDSHPEGVLYALPSDCFTPRRLGPRSGRPNKFRIESDSVLIPSKLIKTYGETPFLRYTAYLDTTGLFPPYFIYAIAAEIASALAMPMTRDKKMETAMSQKAAGRLARAMFIDANLDSGDDEIDKDLEYDTFIDPDAGGTLFNG